MKHSFLLKLIFVGMALLAFILILNPILKTQISIDSFNPIPLEQPLPSLFLENLTWVEVRNAVHRGYTTILIPTGGIEQNGPHLILGKHNYIIRYTAGQIASRLGHTLVAPVIAYVPEGDIDTRSGHMHYPGTISIGEETFQKILEEASRSLLKAGFKTVFFLGDSGDNQKPQTELAAKLDQEFAQKGARIFQVGDYYFKNGQSDWLKSEGETDLSMGTHAGIRDTSELMAVYPQGVRPEILNPNGGSSPAVSGVKGDPTKASAQRGQKLLELKIQAAIKQIQNFSESSSH